MTFETIIKSNFLHLRRTIKDDLDFVITTEQQPENKKYITSWTIDKHLEALCSRDHLHLIIESNNLKIGYIILSGLSNPNNCVELTRINISAKGKGHGKESIKLIQEFVFNHLKAHRLWLDVKEHNERAKHVYEVTGFKPEGILRECIQTEGEYESLIIMGILEKEYRDIEGDRDFT